MIEPKFVIKCVISDDSSNKTIGHNIYFSNFAKSENGVIIEVTHIAKHTMVFGLYIEAVEWLKRIVEIQNKNNSETFNYEIVLVQEIKYFDDKIFDEIDTWMYSSELI